MIDESVKSLHGRYKVKGINTQRDGSSGDYRKLAEMMQT